MTTMDKIMGMASLYSAMGNMFNTDTYYQSSSSPVPYSKHPMNKHQLLARAKAKRARKSRKANKH